MKATVAAEKADKRQNIDIKIRGDNEVSIQYHDIMYIHY